MPQSEQLILDKVMKLILNTFSTDFTGKKLNEVIRGTNGRFSMEGCIDKVKLELRLYW